MKNQTSPKILVWDLETAGVSALHADRGYVACFGYKWLGNGPAKCKTIAEYPVSGKWQEKCQDDRRLLAAALEIIEEADLTVAHFGEKFDKPFIESRLLHAGLNPLPKTRLVDTCLLSRARLRLSSNRLGNLATFLDVPTKKMEKRDGWPKWWMGALRGDIGSIRSLARYCIQDVECLAQCFERMKHIIPPKYLVDMRLFDEGAKCPSCGSHRVQSRGRYWAEGHIYRRFQCPGCGKWLRGKRPEK